MHAIFVGKKLARLAVPVFRDEADEDYEKNYELNFEKRLEIPNRPRMANRCQSMKS